MISANGGLPAHSYTPQVTQRWSRGSEPASGGGVIGAVVVRVVLATVGCRGWCIGCWCWSCSWFVGSPCPAVVVLVVSMFVEAVGDARGSWPRAGWWWRW